MGHVDIVEYRAAMVARQLLSGKDSAEVLTNVIINYEYQMEALRNELSAIHSKTNCTGCVYNGCDYETFQTVCRVCRRMNSFVDYYKKETE